MIFSSLLILSLSIFLLGCNSAPTIYDQRQNGEFNADGRLDNFMFLLMPTIPLISNIDYASLLNYKSMARQFIGKKNKESKLEEPILSIAKEEFYDDIKSGKPYQVDIVKIPKDKEMSGQDLKDLIKEELKNLKNEAKVTTQDLHNLQSSSKDSVLSLKKDEDERTSSDHQELANTKDKLKETKLQ